MKYGEPGWKRGKRFERVGTFAISAAPAAIFPLLCPVLEYDWIPDWRCTMRYSESGVAERDAVFTTPAAPGMEATWTTITYEPPHCIEYLIVQGTRAVIRLSLRLTATGNDGTEVEWRMLFTTMSRLAGHLTDRRFSETAFHAFLAERRAQLEAYFAAVRGTSSKRVG